MKTDMIDFVLKAEELTEVTGKYVKSREYQDTYTPKKLLSKFALKMAIWATVWLTKRLVKELEND